MIARFMSFYKPGVTQGPFQTSIWAILGSGQVSLVSTTNRAQMSKSPMPLPQIRRRTSHQATRRAKRSSREINQETRLPSPLAPSIQEWTPQLPPGPSSGPGCSSPPSTARSIGHSISTAALRRHLTPMYLPPKTKRTITPHG